MSEPSAAPPRPARICAALLAALEAADGRRRQRKRDQTPDAIGLAIKRQLLARVVDEDPDPAAFEGWLLTCMAQIGENQSAGSVAAMARVVLDEWRMAHSMRDFARWLESGAPSADAHPGPGREGGGVGRETRNGSGQGSDLASDPDPRIRA